MTFAERLSDWNRWYDGLPQEWRFQLILWPLIALGACNMLLSLSSAAFPFGLLVLLGVLFVAAVRVPYILGWITPGHALPSGEPGGARLQIAGAGADWITGVNERYEAVPEHRRFWIFPAILLIAGAVNMQLTISYGWSFGLLFLLALLAIVAVRAPYVHGLLRSSPAGGAPAPALQYDARNDARIVDQRPPTPAMARPNAVPLAAPAQHDTQAPGADDGPAHAPAPDTGLASDVEPHGAPAITPPFAAPPRSEPGGAEPAHAPAPPRQPSGDAPRPDGA